MFRNIISLLWIVAKLWCCQGGRWCGEFSAYSSTHSSIVYSNGSFHWEWCCDIVMWLSPDPVYNDHWYDNAFWIQCYKEDNLGVHFEFNATNMSICMTVHFEFNTTNMSILVAFHFEINATNGTIETTASTNIITKTHVQKIYITMLRISLSLDLACAVARFPGIVTMEQTW